jgi:serine/threonine protein kinase
MVEDLAISSEFGGYRIDGMIARGGMGVLYRATQIATDRQVALKLIAPEFCEDDYFRRRFEREARLAARVQHPNVIPIFETGECDGQLFLSMQLIDGIDLGASLAVDGPPPARGAAAIVAAVASGLDAAHAEGLVHRDVKPGNVLLEDDHVYLTDFGLSKVASSRSGLTKTGRWVGTVDYASPEQIQAQTVDARTDVYALGCVLYEALTGRLPFPKPREVSVLMAHIMEPPPAVSDVAPDLAEMDDVVRRAMAKDPEERYPSAGAMGEDAVNATARCPEGARARPSSAGEETASRPADSDAPTVG